MMTMRNTADDGYKKLDFTFLRAVLCNGYGKIKFRTLARGTGKPDIASL